MNLNSHSPGSCIFGFSLNSDSLHLLVKYQLFICFEMGKKAIQPCVDMQQEIRKMDREI